MTPQEKTDLRVQLDAMVDAEFGLNHGCNVDLGAMLRSEGDTQIRFTHNGKLWEMRRLRGIFTLKQIK
jgi:hypothetical protein